MMSSQHLSLRDRILQELSLNTKISADDRDPIKSIVLDVTCLIQDSLPLLQHREIDGGPKHNETLIEHMEYALVEMLQLTDKPLLRLAAFLHDIGKLAVALDQGSSLKFHDHDTIGAQIVYEWSQKNGFNHYEARYLSKMVRYHMWQFSKKSKKSTIRKWLKKIGPDYQDLFLLRLADRAANKAKTEEPLHTYMHGWVEDQIAEILNSGHIVFYSDLDISPNTLRCLRTLNPDAQQEAFDSIFGFVYKYEKERNNPQVIDSHLERNLLLAALC